MKTVRIFTLLAIVSCAFAQKSYSQSTYDELMRKSRQARTTSTILVATGPVIAAAGIGTLIYGLIENEIGDPIYIYDNNGNYIGQEQKKHTTEIVVGSAATLVGIGLALTSIHFSNKASDLKREARKMKLKSSVDRINIPGLQANYTSLATRQYKLSLVIPL